MDIRDFIQAYNMEMLLLDQKHKKYEPTATEVKAWTASLNESVERQEYQNKCILLVNEYNKNMEKLLTEDEQKDCKLSTLQQWRDCVESEYNTLYPFFPNLKELEALELAFKNVLRWQAGKNKIFSLKFPK